MQIDSVPCSPFPYGVAWPNGVWIHEMNLPPGLGDQLLHFDVSSDGRVAGQGQNTGLCCYWDGSRWMNLGATVGVRTCAFGPDGTLFVALGTHIAKFDKAGNSLGTLPIPTGSQGIRYIDAAGNPVIGDATLFDGVVHEYTDIGDGIKIGQGHNGGAVAEVDGKNIQLVPGEVYFPFVKRIGQQLAITVASQSTHSNVRILTTVTELKSLQPTPVPPPVPIPVPVPVPEPPKPPTMPSPLATIEAIRTKYPTPLGATHGAFLIETALALGMDLLRKDGGTHVTLPDGTNVSQDILLDAGRNGYDILSDGENTAKASWGGPVIGSPFSLAQVYRPTSSGPAPTPVPTPSGGTIDGAIASMITAALKPLNAAIEDLKARPSVQPTVVTEDDIRRVIEGLKIALQTDNGHFFSAQDGGGGIVSTQRPEPGKPVEGYEPGAWETFTIKLK